MDWNGKDEELQRPKDDVDKIDHEAMYLEDYSDDIPDLENTEDLNSSVYDRLGATLASTMVSTDTEVINDMFSLSMGPPEPPAPRAPSTAHSKPTAPQADEADAVLSDDEQFRDMFRIPVKVPVHLDTLPPKSGSLDLQALMAETQYQSGQRTLPPPPGLKTPLEAPDTKNLVLKAIEN